MPLGRYWIRTRRGNYAKRNRINAETIYKKNSKTYRSVKSRTGKGLKVTRTQNTFLHTPLLPLKKQAFLPYYDQNNFNTGAVLAGGYVFSANGLFDPNITGVGHQPMGFDQMMLFYEHYTVTKAKITVNFYNNDPNDSVVVGVLTAPDATIETNFSKLNENGMLVKKWIQPTGANNENANNQASFTVMANIAKLNGKSTVLLDDIFRGDAAANPAEQTYFHLFAYNQNSVNVVNVSFEVLISYEATFTEPRKMTQS